MITMIKRSIFMSLFCLLIMSILMIFIALGLNKRFVDSAVLGWIVFLFIPILLALPMAIGGILLGLVPPREEARHAKRFLRLFISFLVAPAGGYLVYSSLTHVINGHLALVICGTFVGVILLIAVCFSAANLIAPKLTSICRTLGWSLVAIFFLTLVVLPIMGSWVSHRPISVDKKSHLMVFGIDAADWAIIDQMITKGDLPTFKRLLEEGARYNSAPIEPFMSPMLWTTIASGVGADKHGIIGPNCYFATSSDVRAPRIWDMVEQNGGTFGLLGWPITWPPRPVKGFIIPSLFDRGPETYPKELKFIRQLSMREKGKSKRDFRSYLIYGVRSIQYGIKLSTFREIINLISSKGDSKRMAALLRLLQMRMHGDLFVDLWERYHPTFAAFYNNAIDMFGHTYWKYYDQGNFPEVTKEEAARYGDLIPEAYRRADMTLGRILSLTPPDLNVMIVSDHNMQVDKAAGNKVNRLIFAEKLLKILNLEDSLFASIMSTQLYLRPKGNLDGFPDNVRHLMENVKIKEMGESVFLLNVDQSGNLIAKARSLPDIKGLHLILPNGDCIMANEILDENSTIKSGKHGPNAILLLKGPSIKKGMQTGQASILDIAPTALYMLGFPMGENMEGRLLKEAFLDDYRQHNQARHKNYRPVIQPYERPKTVDDEKVRELLKSLGYIH